MNPQKIFYLTKEGLRRVREECAGLEKKREELIAEDGENREELDLMERRLRDLFEVLQAHEIISLPPKHKRDTAQLGATVVIENDAGQTSELTILGTLEADPRLGRISNESPVGRALLGSRAGDVVLVHSNVKVEYKVKAIRYNSRFYTKEA